MSSSTSAQIPLDASQSASESSGPYTIRADRLSKCYHIYDKPRDRLLQAIFGESRRFYREFWALRDVSFEVARGETLGIVGRNGSGKSTLLQMIAGTLTPTEGTVERSGRVAALLELGSGFNPEFTGRENVVLNASILGLSRSQIAERMDAILSYADIGDFIDQPVKTYSSGMVMRVAFAVMVHVDADVLIIDEALAVGDAFFAQKCMRFLREFRQRGTLLFVSHDAGAVTALCDRAIWLDRGEMRLAGAARDVMDAYLEALIVERQDGVGVRNEPARRSESAPVSRHYHDVRRDLFLHTNLRNDLQISPFDPSITGFGERRASIEGVVISDESGRPLSWAIGGELAVLEIDVRAEAALEGLIVGFYFKDRLGQLLFGDNTFLQTIDEPFQVTAGQLVRARFRFIMPRLMLGDYFVTVGISDGTQQQHVVQHWAHEALTIKSEGCAAPAGLVGIPMIDISLERT